MVVVPIALWPAGGCSDDQSSAMDASRDIDAGSDDDVSDVADTDWGDSADIPSDLDRDVPSPPTIFNLAIVENPANVLSYYIEWRTSEPVITELSVDCGASYSHAFAGTSPVERHSVFVMGLLDGAMCQARVSAEGAGGTESAQTSFTVGPLPDALPQPTLVELNRSAAQAGWTLTNLTNRFEGDPLYVAIFDEQGRYRWYHKRASLVTGADNDVRTVPDGIMIGGSNRLPAALIDWEGRLLWEATFDMHHEIRPAAEPNHYLYLSGTDDCPDDIAAATVNEIDISTDELVWEWSICEHYLPDPAFNDWSHINAVEPFPGENAVLLSSRNIHSLIKVDLDTWEVIWVMGLGTKINSGFDGDFDMAYGDRFYRQHAPEIQPNGNILLFDNGYPGLREYSRAIEIQYDEEEMTAEVVWEYRHDPDLFSQIWGDADRLPNGDTLITFGVRTEGDKLSHLVEVTYDGEVVWEITLPPLWGTYRSERLFELPLGYVIED